MSFKVIFAILAIFSVANAALVQLIAQGNLDQSCTTSKGCGLVSVIIGSTNSLIEGTIDFSSYNGVTINIDAAAALVGAFAQVSTGANNTVNIASSASINTVIVNATGALVIKGSSTLTTSSDVQSSGSIVINTGGSINVNSAAGVIYQNAANLTVYAGASVNGGINVAAGAGATIGATGTSTANAATVSGAVIVNGAATFGSVTFNQAVTAGSSTASSTAASVSVTVSSTATFSSTFTASAQATVTVNAAAAVIAAGTVQSQGSVIVYGAINVTSSTANYVQQSSAASASQGSNLQLNGGSVNVAAGASIQLDGSLGGQGTLTGTVTGSGTLNIGNSPGTVFVNGDYKPSGTATFNLEVASDNSYDKLVVSGTATLNGNLNCILINGYNPGPNTRYQFITANKVTGQYFPVHGTGSNVFKWSQSATASTALANYNSAVTVAISGFLVVACLLASLL